NKNHLLFSYLRSLYFLVLMHEFIALSIVIDFYRCFGSSTLIDKRRCYYDLLSTYVFICLYDISSSFECNEYGPLSHFWGFMAIKIKISGFAIEWTRFV